MVMQAATALLGSCECPKKVLARAMSVLSCSKAAGLTC
jgi:hypothetical protein